MCSSSKDKIKKQGNKNNRKPFSSRHNYKRNVNSATQSREPTYSTTKPPKEGK